MSFFFTDFLSHLSPILLYRLKLTSHQFNRSITLDVINRVIANRVNKRLVSYFEKYCEYADINALLINTKAFISGSFIIQCILDEQYEFSDIDIYIPIANNDKHRILIDNFFTNARIISDSEYYGGGDPDNTSSVLKICRVTDYDLDVDPLDLLDPLDEWAPSEKLRKYVQIINVNIDSSKESMTNYINEYFDFDICKNFYMPSTKSVYMHSLYQILNKQLEFKKSMRDVKYTIERAEKYKSRGFNIINHYTVEELANMNLFDPTITVNSYHIKLINMDYKEDCPYECYRIVGGNLVKLQPIHHFIYPNFEPLAKRGECESSAKSEYNLSTVQYYYTLCDQCGNSCKHDIIDRFIEYCENIEKHVSLSICEICKMYKSRMDGIRNIYNDIEKDNVNIVALSNERRNTEIDYCIKFCYPDGNYQILWSGRNIYYLFIIDE